MTRQPTFSRPPESGTADEATSGTERLLRAQEERLTREAEDRQSAEDEHLIRVMRGIAIEEAGHAAGKAMTAADVKAAVADGLVVGVKRLANDDAFMSEFWRGGFEHLTNRGSDSAQKWIGRRVIVGLAGLLLAAGIYFSAKLGLIK